MKTILITSIGKRVQLVRHFVHSGFRVIGVDAEPDMAPASRFVHLAYQVPRYDNESYISALLDIAMKERVEVLIPLYEPELIRLAGAVDRFQEKGVKVLVSREEALAVCRDKYKLYTLLADSGVATPATYLPDAFEPDADSGRWVVKPRTGMGSKDVFIVNGAEEARACGQRLAGSLIQAYIHGKEYTIDAFVDAAGSTRSVVPRERLEVRAGEVSKSVTCYDETLIRETLAVLSLLPFYGPITVQGIREASSGKFFFTEINPRFGGGVPLAMEAGIPYAALICGSYAGEEELIAFQNNMVMLRYEEAIYTTR